jgi:sugar phosphate isomerase/epimerase
MTHFSRRQLLMAGGAFLAGGARPKFTGKFGLEIYSLRREASKDLSATLAMIRQFGFTDLEVGDLYGRSAQEFRRLLDKAGLKASSMMAAHARLAGEIQAAARDAHTIGAAYVVCSTIPHRKHLTAQDCQQAIKDFNRWGKVLADSKLQLCYHTHGVEFGPSPEGTLFDTLVKGTDPKLVNYEMDIFWIVYAHHDPVKLLHKYPGRFPLMHVKDIRKDTPLGGSPGDVLEEASVILGQGLVDVPAALRAAEATGTRHYYIEDEAVNATEQIPRSLRYLESIR